MMCMCGTGGLPSKVQSRLLAGRVDLRAASNSIPNSQVVFRHLNVQSLLQARKWLVYQAHACVRELHMLGTVESISGSRQ